MSFLRPNGAAGVAQPALPRSPSNSYKAPPTLAGVVGAALVVFGLGTGWGSYQTSLGSLQRDVGEMRGDMKEIKRQLAFLPGLLDTLAEARKALDAFSDFTKRQTAAPTYTPQPSAGTSNSQPWLVEVDNPKAKSKTRFEH